MPDEAQITGVGGNLPANTPQTIGDRKLKPSDRKSTRLNSSHRN